MHTTGMHEQELETVKRALTEYESRLLADWREASATTGPAADRAMARINDKLNRIRSIQRNLWDAGGLAYMQEELPR